MLFLNGKHNMNTAQLHVGGHSQYEANRSTWQWPLFCGTVLLIKRTLNVIHEPTKHTAAFKDIFLAVWLFNKVDLFLLFFFLLIRLGKNFALATAQGNELIDASYRSNSSGYESLGYNSPVASPLVISSPLRFPWLRAPWLQVPRPCTIPPVAIP